MMKSAKFPLESVLQLYGMREDQARAAFGETVRARELIDQALQAARDSLDGHVRACTELRTGRGFSAGSHALHWAAIQEGQNQCKALEMRRPPALQAEAKARAILLEARRKHEMIKKLRDRHREQYRLESLRQEEHALADFFTANLCLRRAAHAREGLN